MVLIGFFFLLHNDSFLHIPLFIRLLRFYIHNYLDRPFSTWATGDFAHLDFMSCSQELLFIIFSTLFTLFPIVRIFNALMKPVWDLCTFRQ